MDHNMRVRFFSVLSVCFAVTLFAAIYPLQGKHANGDNPSAKEALIVKGVISALEQLHYAPLQLDDEISRKAFNSYLDRLDSGRRFLTSKDVEKLKVYETRIDDEFLNGTFQFFDLSVQLIDAGVRRAEQLYPGLLEEPFDFSSGDYIEFDSDKMPFPDDEKALKARWYQLLKYETLTRLYTKIEDQDNNDTIQVRKPVAELEEEARAEVRKTFGDWFQRLGKLRRSDRFTDYINSVTEIFDPHTNYFDPKEKEDFDINMSGRLEGIGARLQTDGEYTKVESIVPGGPAWKQQQLEVGDVIMKVTQAGTGQETVDIRGMRVDDVVKYVRGKKGTLVTLTVRKADGALKDITIERDEVILDESFARSAIISQTGIVDNIGYIRLPKFYADFEKEDGNSCAKDVAKELEKLKKLNVKGVILDLRNNGGGSLRDVVDMSGLFIEDGPIVQVKSRNQAPQVLQDNDPSVQYKGPLIVMVNSLSASASEILAAALQDYGRAVIVGATTFGKGTVQRFYDLDRLVRGNTQMKPLGEVKLTMQKFYRINGGSTQLRGVTPDIVLPDSYMLLDIGEREYEYPMEWSEIPALTYKQSVYKINDLTAIKRKSQERVSTDPVFKAITEHAKRLKSQREEKNYPLNLTTYGEMVKQKEKQATDYNELMKEPLPHMQAENLEFDLAYIQSDPSRVARNDDWLKNIRKDIYLKETLNMMRDLIH